MEKQQVENEEEILKHDLLRANALLWLAIQKLGGELSVAREEYVKLKKVGVLIGQSELEHYNCKDFYRVVFNMGVPVTAYNLSPKEYENSSGIIYD